MNTEPLPCFPVTHRQMLTVSAIFMASGASIACALMMVLQPAASAHWTQVDDPRVLAMYREWEWENSQRLIEAGGAMRLGAVWLDPDETKRFMEFMGSRILIMQGFSSDSTGTRYFIDGSPRPLFHTNFLFGRTFELCDTNTIKVRFEQVSINDLAQ